MRCFTACANMALCLFTPAACAPAFASTLSTVSLIVDGVSILGEATEAARNFSEIFGVGDITSQEDDHPLYTQGGVGPTIQIKGTPHDFRLFLQQTNDVSAFEDDYAARVAGVSRFSDGAKTFDTWKYGFTIEVDLIDDFADMSVVGFVQHIMAPHPETGEEETGKELPFRMAFRQRFTDGETKAVENAQTPLPSEVHPRGTHADSLISAILKAELDGAGIDHLNDFSVLIEANHPRTVPVPATAGLQGVALAALGLAARRRATAHTRRWCASALAVA